MITINEMPKLVEHIKPHVNNLLMAMAHYELESEKIMPIKKRLLEEYDFKVDLDERLPEYGEKITDPEKMYLTTADTSEYYEALHRIYTDAGYELEEVGFCPVLIANSNVNKAENELLKAAGEVVPELDRGIFGKLREKALDLLIKAVVNMPGYKKPV
jgi:hypothetical protein